LYTVKFDAEVEELTSDGDTQSVEVIIPLKKKGA
jgi:hypothetical protein